MSSRLVIVGGWKSLPRDMARHVPTVARIVDSQFSILRPLHSTLSTPPSPLRTLYSLHSTLRTLRLTGPGSDNDPGRAGVESLLGSQAGMRPIGFSHSLDLVGEAGEH